MKKALWIVGITIGIIALVGIGSCSYVISFRNQFVTMEENIKGQWAQVENVLQRRSDLIPNLVNTVKGFASQEKDIFISIAESRAKLSGAATIGDKIKAANGMSSALGRLLVVVERYPDLKSNQNFMALQDELAGTENRITVERKRYNDSVRQYNTGLRRFPGNLIASSMGISQYPYYEVPKEKKEVPKVKF
ncbi:MAG: LemA family protein [Deltaproteobacteria bacterium]|nr:LemA family protein [Deltaproteobacteria bacterium]MCZ6547906.1 LemA family protein [Deltaproteobacteria bacterium]MCZ6907168.1 LemA family protein [Deltaproteobacteria bacterium]